MKKISKGQRYIDVKSEVIIEIIDTDGTGRCTVATVQNDGRLVRQRSMLESSIHPEATTKGGQPWKSGYIPVDAWTKNKEKKDMSDDIDITELDEVELAAYIAKKEAQMKLLKDEADRAKKILKARTSSAGVRIFGEVAVIAKPNHRFDPGYARTNLSPEDYRAICILTPDATVAKKILGEDTDTYRKCLKDHGWSLTVRPATEDDYAAVERAEEMQEYIEEGIAHSKAPF